MDLLVQKPWGNVRKRLFFHASFVTLGFYQRCTEAMLGRKIFPF